MSTPRIHSMKFISKTSLSFAIIFCGLNTVAQKNSAPTVPVEAMFGNNRFAFSTVLIKPFSEKSKFGFLSVTTYAADYKNNIKEHDFISVANVNYKLTKHIMAVIGLSINASSGFHGTAGFQYTYANREWLIIALPVIALSKTYNFEPLGIVEYKPKISTGLSLYTKVQGYYNHETKDDFHARSYVHLRLGVTSGMFTYGFGANEDYYGPKKFLRENYGIFVRAVFK